MQHFYMSDNAGNKAAPGAINADPVAGSGITIDMATAGTDYTQDVVAGQSYIVTVNGGFCLFSTTGATSTEGNIEWCAADGNTIIIKVPIGCETLYCEADTDSTSAYLRKLKT